MPPFSLPRVGREVWGDAGSSGTPIPLGRLVVCDVCDADYTDRPDAGGMIFASWAYCPACMRRALPEIESMGEERFIRARAGADEPFADFVRRYRGPDASIQIITRGTR